MCLPKVVSGYKGGICADLQWLEGKRKSADLQWLEG
jgi:hypothetical protein